MTLFFFLFRKIFSGKRFFINATNLLNLSSISICILFFIVITSIFYGFQKQIKNSIFEFDAHLTIKNSLFSNTIENYADRIHEIRQIIDPVYLDLIQGMIHSPAIMRHLDHIEHVFLRGQEFVLTGQEYQIPKKFFPKIIAPKEIQTLKKGNYCFIGAEMALYYHLEVGDSIELIVANGQFLLKEGLEPSLETFEIAGIFQSNNYDYDSKMVIIPLREAQELFSLKGMVQSIILKLTSVNEIRRIQKIVSEHLPIELSILSLFDEQKIFFSALRLEKTIVSIIMFLFILLSILLLAFVTNTTIRNKKREIGILKAMGISNLTLILVFMTNIIIISLIGIVIGLILGILLALQLDPIIKGIEQMINYVGLYLSPGTWQVIQLVPSNIYYFDKIPIHISNDTIFITTVVTFCLTCLVTFIPLMKIRKIYPIEIIKNSGSGI